MFRIYDVPGIVMSGGICFLNMRNVKRSPQYTEPQNATDTVRFAALSIVKGSIYGFFWPFALAGIVIDLPNKKAFDRHFVPFSCSKQ